jgi:hypothetical protein
MANLLVTCSSEPQRPRNSASRDQGAVTRGKVIYSIQLLPQYLPSPNSNKCMADQQLQRNLLHVFKIPEVFIAICKHLSCLPGRFLAHYHRHQCLTQCLFEDSSSSCLFNCPGPSLAHYSCHRCLASLLITVVAFLHLQ